MTRLRRYIFDVDGTLTPSRGKIDPEFKEFFLDFIEKNKVWLVTGSDYPKTVEQLGEDICENVVTCYSCSGNETRFKGKVCNATGWEIDPACVAWMERKLKESEFHIRTGNHIEYRRGTVNFSIVGRNANQQERNAYVQYDLRTNERANLMNEFNYIFGPPALTHTISTIGGETGLDIYRYGNDKSQILNDFNKDDDLHFFGDKMERGGNDYPLAVANKNGTNHHVKNWQETWEILKCLQ